MSITPKRWDEFQHYKDRSPVWIKLHRKLLDDFAFSRLPVASRALAPMLWLLASEYDGGSISASTEEIAYRMRMPEKELRAAIKPLIDNGFFTDDSNTLADCYQVATPEKERETQVKTEEEKKEMRANARQTRGTRLPADWKPSEKAIEYAESRGLSWSTEAEKFCDYWWARAGPRAVSLNWEANWRSWCRNALKFNGNGGNGQTPRRSRITEVIDRMLDESGANETPRPAMREITPRLLPFRGRE